MNIHALYARFSRRFRAKRMRLMVDITGISESSTVLDIGGTAFNWQFLPFRPRVVFLNLRDDGQRPLVVADGCLLPFGDDAFDLVFSNSLIEHLFTIERQRQFAGECRRVGRSYFVQTPARNFPFEPHRLVPWYNAWPDWAKRRAHALTPWGWLTGAGREEAAAFVDEHRPLDRRDLAALFPGARVVEERAAGLVKSLIAVGR